MYACVSATAAGAAEAIDETLFVVRLRRRLPVFPLAFHHTNGI
jgi:hypothetical protein